MLAGSLCTYKKRQSSCKIFLIKISRCDRGPKTSVRVAQGGPTHVRCLPWQATCFAMTPKTSHPKLGTRPLLIFRYSQQTPTSAQRCAKFSIFWTHPLTNVVSYKAKLAATRSITYQMCSSEKSSLIHRRGTTGNTVHRHCINKMIQKVNDRSTNHLQQGVAHAKKLAEFMATALSGVHLDTLQGCPSRPPF